MLTMMISMMHRITGAILYFGALFLVWWLAAAAAGPEYFSLVHGYLTSWLGLLVLFGFTWALIHHLIGGLKHFLWDTGAGFERPMLEILAIFSALSSPALAVVVWAIAYLVR